MTKAKYADVAPAVPLPAGGRQTYTYQLPLRTADATIARRFSSVAIPFGSRTVPGVVLKLHSQQRSGPAKTVKIISGITLTDQQVRFARWVARLAQGGLGYTLRLCQPPTKRLPAAEVAVKTPSSPPQTIPATPRAVIQKDTLKRHAALANLTDHAIAKGAQALVVVPERWMAKPLAQACMAVSGDCVTVVHASKSASSLSALWHQIKRGQPHIVIGTQKALFLPYHNLSVVAIEEEQLQSHKLWDQYPRLHNVYAAEKLADLHGATLVYGTSFPSLRLHYAMQEGAVRARDAHPVKLRPRIVTFSFDDKARKYPLPKELLSKLKQWHRQGQSTLIFYNRKATHTFLEVLKKHGLDKRTSANLTVATSAIFTANPQQHYDHVVWLFPERGLVFPDYRASENVRITGARLQQIQVSSRRSLYIVTRRDLAAELLSDDEEIVTERLLAERKRYGYPPFTELVRLTVTAKTRRAAFKKGEALRQAIDQRQKDRAAQLDETIQVRGPYRGREKATRGAHTTHLVLTGPLEALMVLYDGLPVTAADLAPAQIV